MGEQVYRSCLQSQRYRVAFWCASMCTLLNTSLLTVTQASSSRIRNVRPAFSLLTKLLDEFTVKIPQSSFSNPSAISPPEITIYIQKCQDPARRYHHGGTTRIGREKDYFGRSFEYNFCGDWSSVVTFSGTTLCSVHVTSLHSSRKHKTTHVRMPSLNTLIGRMGEW